MREHKSAEEELIFVIEGQPYPFKVGLDETLGVAIADVLEKTGHTGRPASDWIARNQAGDLLDPSKTVRQLALVPGNRVFLSPGAGVGG